VNAPRGRTFVPLWHTAWCSHVCVQPGRLTPIAKPVTTGMVAPGDPAFQHSDAAQLLSAQGSPCDETTIAACTPWRFVAPLSPDMAAAAADHRLELGEILSWARGARFNKFQRIRLSC
jgi:dethiobiotin synthetase